MTIAESVAQALQSDPLLRQLADAAHKAAEGRADYSRAASDRTELLNRTFDLGIPASAVARRTRLTSQRISEARQLYNESRASSSEVA